MPITDMVKFSFCPKQASFSGTAPSVSKRALLVWCSTQMVVSNEGACNAYYRYGGIDA